MARVKAYRLNLIRELRKKEREAERRKRNTALFGVACFVFLALALVYSGVTIWRMERVLRHEQTKLENVQNEYRKYRSTKLIVDKGDLEQLDLLKRKGVFWTKKLSALAKHLPDNYWINRFTFANGELRVSGYGQATSRQDQLLVLDAYLKRLREDSTFSDTFISLQLNVAENRGENPAGMVGFDFSALTREAGKVPQ